MLVLLLVISTVAAERDCASHLDCQNRFKSGVCYEGKCVCHPSAHPPYCQTEAQLNEVHGRKRFEIVFDEVTWEEAQLNCRKKLGTLALIEDQRQNDYIGVMIAQRKRSHGLENSNLFFGLTFKSDAKRWEWVSGAPFNGDFFTSWEQNEPSMGTPLDRDSHAVINERGRWTVAASNFRHGYVCEYDGVEEYEVVMERAPFSEAEEKCRDRGLDVVSISDSKVYKYVRALYSLNDISSAWVGLHYSQQFRAWRWNDGTSMNQTIFNDRINNSPDYDISKRAELVVATATFAIIDGESYSLPYICKSAEVKRDCRVLKELDPSLPSGHGYYIRPRYDEYSVYCDMTTDGGGYTYYIPYTGTQKNEDISTVVKAGLERLCTTSFNPIDIKTAKQVVELEQFLRDEEYDLERGVVPIAEYRAGAFRTLHSRRDLTDLLFRLVIDYKINVTAYGSGDTREGFMLGIGAGNTLTSYYPKGTVERPAILAVVCSTNNLQPPPTAFSVSYTSHDQYYGRKLVSHTLERSVELNEATICTWLRTTSPDESVVFSLESDSSVLLQMVLSPREGDHFVLRGGAKTQLGVGWGVGDGSLHRVCLLLASTGYEVTVDGTSRVGESSPRATGNLQLSGTFTIGVDGSGRFFLGQIESVDVWDHILTNVNISVGRPVYDPGNVISWSDFYSDNDAIGPAQLFGYSRFKVGVGPSGLRWSKNYCLARGGELGAPRNDHEYNQILDLLQGNSGWIAVSRQNNVLISETSTPNISLTYIPTTGENGSLAINEQGDLEVRTVNDLLSFVCQFNVTEEPVVPEQECIQEQTFTDKGTFSWVKATVNRTVKVMCPHGAISDDFKFQSYASRKCMPSNDTTHGVWSSPDMERCNYANAMTQQLDLLSKTPVTSENAAEIAEMVQSITNDSSKMDGAGLSIVVTIIEDLVLADNGSATDSIGHSLSNLLDVEGVVLAEAQTRDRTADRIVGSLERVAGSLGNTTQQQSLQTRNVELNAVFVDSPTVSAELVSVSQPDVAVNIPPAASPANKSAYLIVYKNVKLFMTDLASLEEAEYVQSLSNNSEPSPPFINTPIISAGLDGAVVRNISQPVTLLFPVLQEEAGSAECVFYDPTSASWVGEGLQTIHDNVTGHVTCLSDHMTSFAVIMTIQPDTHPIDGVHGVILTTLTYVCLLVSLVGLLLTVFALSLQRSLWRLDMTKIHVNLSIALFIGYVVFLVGIDQTPSRFVCVTSAFLMHLVFLIAFMWMAIEAYTLYLQFVKVFPSYTPNFIPKCMIAVFSLPMALAGGFLVAALSTDVTAFYEVDKFCWIKSYTLYYGFILPILLVIVCNMLIFAYVTRNICRIVNLNAEDSKLGQFNVQLRAALSVLVVLGITWLLGAFTFGSASLWFQYAFTVLNGLQGFSIFLFHVLLKPDVRRRWYNSFNDITNSLSSNSHALKSHSFHRAHKYQVTQLQDKGTNLKHNPSICSNNSQKQLISNDKRFTYLSSSNDYATIESRPSSISITTTPAADHTPLINMHPATPPGPLEVPLVTKRPLSTVNSLEPSSPGDQASGTFAFSPVDEPGEWEYNPLRLQQEEEAKLREEEKVREEEKLREEEKPREEEKLREEGEDGTQV